MPNRAKWRTLADRLEGSLVLPGAPEYAWAGKRFIAQSPEATPVAMARCATPEDVRLSIVFAQSHALPFALRSGGHSHADHSSTTGLLIDLARMNSIAVDGHMAVVGAGATIGGVAERLARHERVLPSGSWPTVGMAGIALGGGFGFHGRQYGLTTDHIVAAQVVLADGRLTITNESSHPDLLWALRGAGGGNFGAVTSLVFRTHATRTITAIYCRWPVSHAPAVIDRWQCWAPDLPDEVTLELGLSASDFNDQQPAIELFGASLLDGVSTAHLLREFAGAVGAPAEPMSVTTMSGPAGARYQAGLVGRDNGAVCIPEGPFPLPGFQFVKSEFFRQPLPVDAIALLVEHLAANRSCGERRDIEFVPWRGAYGRVAADAVAFVHRDPLFLLKHSVLLGSSATDDRLRSARRWVQASWETARPYGSGGVYPAFPDNDLVDWPRAYYGTNLKRLRDVKAVYDRDNVFAFRQSIPGTEIP